MGNSSDNSSSGGSDCDFVDSDQYKATGDASNFDNGGYRIVPNFGCDFLRAGDKIPVAIGGNFW